MRASSRFGNAIGHVTCGALRLLKADLQNAAIRSDEPSGFGTGECYGPKAAHTGQREPGVSLVRSPGSDSSRKRGRVIGGDHHGTAKIVSAPATSLSNVAQSKYRAGYRRRTCGSPRSTTIAGNCRARVIGVTGIEVAAAHDSVVRVAKINRECACTGRTKQRSVIGGVGVDLIRSGKDPGDVSAACGNPRVPPALRGDAGSARGERKFARQSRWHVAADVLPRHSIERTKVGKDSVHRITMQNSSLRRPEREPVIESTRILILKLDRPGGATI